MSDDSTIQYAVVIYDIAINNNKYSYSAELFVLVPDKSIQNLYINIIKIHTNKITQKPIYNKETSPTRRLIIKILFHEIVFNVQLPQDTKKTLHIYNK